MSEDIDLRTFAFLDSLQPQLTAYMASTSQGYLPITYDASLWVEIAPGMSINRITDLTLKKTNVRPGVQVVERAFGVLEVHHESQGEVQRAAEQVLSFLDLEQEGRIEPSVMTSQTITGIDDYQAMLINRDRDGNMFLAGETLYILEVHPAAYAAYAANEAEKAADIKLIDVRPVGAYGRLFLSGRESEIEEAASAAQSAIASVSGRKEEG